MPGGGTPVASTRGPVVGGYSLTGRQGVCCWTLVHSAPSPAQINAVQVQAETALEWTKVY